MLRGATDWHESREVVTLVLLRCPMERTGQNLVLGQDGRFSHCLVSVGQLETWGLGWAVNRDPQSRVESLKTRWADHFEAAHLKATIVHRKKGRFRGREN